MSWFPSMAGTPPHPLLALTTRITPNQHPHADTSSPLRTSRCSPTSTTGFLPSLSKVSTSPPHQNSDFIHKTIIETDSDPKPKLGFEHTTLPINNCLVDVSYSDHYDEGTPIIRLDSIQVSQNLKLFEPADVKFNFIVNRLRKFFSFSGFLCF